MAGVEQAATLALRLIAEAQALRALRIMSDRAKLELDGATGILQDAHAAFQRMEGEPPPLVASAMDLVRDDISRLHGAKRLWFPSARLNEMAQAAKSLGEHKTLLNTEILKVDARQTRAAVEREQAERQAREAREADERARQQALHPALQQALLTMRHHQDDLQAAAHGQGPAALKLTVDALKLLADHWGIDLPRKVRKKQDIVDFLDARRPRATTKSLPHKAPLADVSNRQMTC